MSDSGYPICYDLPLFATIRDCSPLFALFETIRTIHTIRYSGVFAVGYSRLFAIRYSGFPDTRYNVSSVGLLLILPPFNEVCHCVYTTKNFTSVK